MVCVITGKQNENLVKVTETIPALTKDLFRLLKWLEEYEVTHIAMESTGIYWKPVFNILEDFFDITLEMPSELKMSLEGKRMSPMLNGSPSFCDMD